MNDIPRQPTNESGCYKTKEREKVVTNSKLSWQGTVMAVQPRIRLTRSFDQRSHSYLGYALRLQGQIGDREKLY